MTAHYHYSHATTPAGPGFDVDLGTSVVLVGVGSGGGAMQNTDAFPGLQTSAVTGESAQSSVIFDDPTASLGCNSYSGGIDGLRRFYMTEDSCPSNDWYVYNGYVGAREYHRGDDYGITATGVARRIMTELSDDNAILRFRLATGSDANRPTETAGARLKWLLSSDYLNTVHDDGLVAYPCNSMSCNSYIGQYAGDILGDIAIATKMNYWAQYNQATGHIQLWFDRAGSSNFASTLQISNVAADVDNVTTFAPVTDPGNWPVLRRDPSRTYAGVYVPYRGGSIYMNNLNTSYLYGYRDGVAPNANVSTLAAAQAIASNFLSDASTENDVVTCSILLPPSQLTAIKPGHRLYAKFSHFPYPYNSFTPYRVIRRTVMRPQPTDQRYEMKLEMSPINAAQGLHQVVLQGQATPFPQQIAVGAATPDYFAGGGAGAARPDPIIADTDGYAQKIVDAGAPHGYVVRDILIPHGLGGTYAAGIESINLPPGWVGSTTVYPFGHVATCLGVGILTGIVMATVYVNGIIVSSFTTAQDGGSGSSAGLTRAGYGTMTLNDGDLVQVWSENLGTELGGVPNEIGVCTYGSPSGVFALVRISD